VEFARQGLWPAETIADRAAGLALARPDDPCLIDEAGTVSFAALWADAQALAAALRARGFLPGEVVAFQLPNWREAAVLNLACALAGLVVNPIVPIYRDAELRVMLGDCGARALFVPTLFRKVDYAAMAARVRAGSSRADPCVHGTRGRPGRFRRAGGGRARVARCARGGRSDGREDGALHVRHHGAAQGVLHSHATLGRVIGQSAAFWGLQAGTQC
jgi:hypothetical protein